MTSQQIIDKELSDAFDKFYDSIYAGKVEVPDELINKYKIGIMALSAHSHQTNFHKVKSIVSKKKDELTNSEVRDMIKVILNTPLEKMYGNVDYAIAQQIKLQSFIICFNGTVDAFQQKIQEKKTRLSSLSGLGGNNNGLSIIN